jgi:hypothetical protein
LVLLSARTIAVTPAPSAHIKTIRARQTSFCAVVEPCHPGAVSLTVSKNLQLVAKSHHLELKLDARPEAAKKAMNDGTKILHMTPTLRGIPS